MFANQCEEIVWNKDTKTNSTATRLKHVVFNILASFGSEIIGSLSSESQNGISEDLKY